MKHKRFFLRWFLLAGLIVVFSTSILKAEELKGKFTLPFDTYWCRPGLDQAQCCSTKAWGFEHRLEVDILPQLGNVESFAIMSYPAKKRRWETDYLKLAPAFSGLMSLNLP